MDRESLIRYAARRTPRRRTSDQEKIEDFIRDALLMLQVGHREEHQTHVLIRVPIWRLGDYDRTWCNILSPFGPHPVADIRVKYCRSIPSLLIVADLVDLIKDFLYREPPTELHLLLSMEMADVEEECDIETHEWRPL